MEDDPKTAGLLKLYLEHAGYDVTVVPDGREALRASAEPPAPDLVLLDVMIPHVDGFRVCQELRLAGDPAIILLTARSTEEDRLQGLDLGADDYVTKPFSPREVVARVRAVLRRSPRGAEASRRAVGAGGGSTPAAVREEPGATVAAAGVTIDPSRREARVRGRRVDLTPREFEILSALVRRPGRVFTRADLMAAAFGDGFVASERAVDAHVKNLRAKVEADPSSPRIIRTVFGVGYRLAEERDDA